MPLRTWYLAGAAAVYGERGIAHTPSRLCVIKGRNDTKGKEQQRQRRSHRLRLSGGRGERKGKGKVCVAKLRNRQIVEEKNKKKKKRRSEPAVRPNPVQADRRLPTHDDAPDTLGGESVCAVCVCGLAASNIRTHDERTDGPQPRHLARSQVRPRAAGLGATTPRRHCAPTHTPTRPSRRRPPPSNRRPARL
jgi:hypothetical protein